MDNEKGCPNCFYDNFDGKAYPCSMCIRGLERKDMWRPEATGKDEPQIEPNLILPEKMERGDMYQVGETIVVMNLDDYLDLICQERKHEPWQSVVDEDAEDCQWK